jgi:hypothetical protein
VRSSAAEDSEVGIVVVAGWTHYEIFPRYGCKPFLGQNSAKASREPNENKSERTSPKNAE